MVGMSELWRTNYRNCWGWIFSLAYFVYFGNLWMMFPKALRDNDGLRIEACEVQQHPCLRYATAEQPGLRAHDRHLSPDDRQRLQRRGL